jgi:uncharacterized phage protein gp47/JayE
MPFVRSTPAEMRERLRAEVAAALEGSDPRQRRSVEEVLVRLIAIASEEEQQHLDWVADQVMVDTAEAEFLDRHGAIWGIPRLPASAARGSVTVTGTPGAVVPAGTELRRGDDARYTLDGDVAIGAGGAATGGVTATTPGALGNAEPGTALTFVTPAAGIASGAVVAAGGLAAGSDQELDDELRPRVLAKIQDPPAGGKASDYAAWARAVPGVGRVFVFPTQYGPGTVAVLFLTQDGGIPPAPLVTAVAEAIELERPVTAAVSVLAPTASPVAFSIELDPDTAASRAAAAAALAEYFAEEAAPGGTLRLSRASAAISAASGETWHRIALPADDVTLGWGQLPTLGPVTWL